MALDTDTVRRIARLAKIHVDDADLAPLADELNNILGWIEQLDEVDRALNATQVVLGGVSSGPKP